VLDLSAIGVVHRDRIQGYVEKLRRVEARLLEQRQARLDASGQVLRDRFVLLALTTLALTALATLGLRGVTGRLAAVQRRLRHEVVERGVARERQREAQCRLEMVLEHVNEAVIGLDERLRVQWLNPAGEAMFGRTRASLRGQPLSELLPGIDHELQRPDPQPLDDDDDDEPSRHEPWLVLRTARECRRADGVRFIAEAALVQGRVNGELIAVCVCRGGSVAARWGSRRCARRAAPARTGVRVSRSVRPGPARFPSLHATAAGLHGPTASPRGGVG